MWITSSNFKLNPWLDYRVCPSQMHFVAHFAPHLLFMSGGRTLSECCAK